MKINLLDDTVINQIAAGEVVERPASVVRELVDNSVDAKSTLITISLEDGGKRLIRVVDNGCGMSRDDARLACERHATSKILKADELSTIHTLGFRGEALSSIAAVSRLKLITRTAEDDAATEISIDGGVLRSVNIVAAPVGTDLQVANLFFNTPARKKFLKQAATETQRVKQWLLQSAISHPQIHYRLEVDGKNTLNLSPQPSMIDRAKGIFKGSSVTFNEEFGPLKICGLLCHPAMAQVDTKALVVLINHRLVFDKIVLKAAREGFSSTLKGAEYPLGFISIEMPTSEVDVNVHPQKSEVRFRSGGDVFIAVREVVRRSVQGFSGPVITNQKGYALGATFEGGGGVQSPYTTPPLTVATSPTISSATETFSKSRQLPFIVQSEEFAHSLSTLDQEEDLPELSFSKLRYIGQTLSCYLLCDLDDVFYVIDMHAAHERCNYNKIRKAFTDRDVESQLMLIPQSVELTEVGLEQCLSRKEVLRQFGFEIERFGNTTLLIRAVPLMISGANLDILFKEIAALEDEMGLGAIDRLIDHIAARIACHASLRSGDKVTREEVYALFADLDNEQFNSACPHGRPVITSFKKGEIERWFGRDR
ncbi:MAG: DNA mismatch repair endonuclease MutL [Bdellovibrionota bacterium]|jgi:DNA mismatch repair protein MutL